MRTKIDIFVLIKSFSYKWYKKSARTLPWSTPLSTHNFTLLHVCPCTPCTLLHVIQVIFKPTPNYLFNTITIIFFHFSRDQKLSSKQIPTQTLPESIAAIIIKHIQAIIDCRNNVSIGLKLSNKINL